MERKEVLSYVHRRTREKNDADLRKTLDDLDSKSGRRIDRSRVAADDVDEDRLGRVRCGKGEGRVPGGLTAAAVGEDAEQGRLADNDVLLRVGDDRQLLGVEGEGRGGAGSSSGNDSALRRPAAAGTRHSRGLPS